MGIRMGIKLKLNFNNVFKSKRNLVILNGVYVEKHFPTKEAAIIEKNQLLRLQKSRIEVNVPKIVTNLTTENVVTTEYIEGLTLTDFIDDLESYNTMSQLFKRLIAHVANELFRWFFNFHRAVDNLNTKEIKGDVNGRNFIFDGLGIWGLDFEEKAEGEVEKDIGRLIAFILTYDPAFTTVKKFFEQSLLSKAARYSRYNKDKILFYRDEEIKAIEKRRIKF